MDKYTELQEKIKLKRLELATLEEEYDKFPRNILMYRKSKGKHAFVFQPLKQLHSLKTNGWVVIEDFNNFVENNIDI